MATLTKKTLQSKGDRLNWEPVSSVKHVVVTTDMMVGKRLSADDLRKNSNYNASKFRIP
jgi:plastocyanin